VRDSFRAFSKALQTRIARHGVTMGQWYFLRVLWEEDGLTQRELSRRVGMMEPTTVSALNTMQKAALIRRQRNEQDRRKVNIFLTKKGAALKEELLPDAIAVNEAAVAGVSPEEVETLRRVLDRIKSNLE
jgi:DNA-binding MarR family transcriptional regulator